ncbi:MerR family transcriptional regulator [Catellatospora citrea]|uniref:Transcriptional regulator n=1 Tax=Catellatospora citrea TaxID=53366 RepID=A0A8J3P4C0_9ACTN|nr:MerR family transcriptional regulator [Catellatospora citrea]RKE06354.1 B12 binding protein [Catellatospora citrea]GIG01016.1 transcriptional regulator [Catellatospora citrea]
MAGEDEGLSAGAVARRLGIAVTTLRTWHQRYGLGPSGHDPGHHRRYDADALARLETMRRLTAQGVPAAEAARVARSATADGIAQLAEPRPHTRDGGGHTVAVGRAGAQARGLARAAMRLDALTVRHLVQESVAEHGVVDAWQDLLVPVLVGIGTRHAATQRLIDVEHLVSRCVSEVFGGVRRPAPGSPVPVLLACADEEQHSLPLEAMAAALAERGVGARLLGARVPPRALLDAVRRTGPSIVVVWSHLPETADVATLRELLALPKRPPVIAAAGPGWPDDLPDGVLRPDTLDAALVLVAAVVAPA